MGKYILTSKDELYHYGIKGMKWGVRRYQDKNGRLTAKGKERYRNTRSGMSRFAGMLDPNLNFPSGYEQDTFTEIVAKPNDKGGYNWWTPLHDDIRYTRLNTDYLTDPDSAMEKHASKINKGHGSENGASNNCTKVAANNCLAMMGWDFDAGRCMRGDANAFDYWFDGEEKLVVDNVREAVDQKLSKTIPGSFGTIDLRRGDGKGGHVFNWQRKSTGAFSLVEGQPSGEAEVFTGSSPDECINKYITKRPWFSADATVRVYDMTNATPNWAHMEEDSVCRITDDPDYRSGILDRKTGQLYDNL